MVNVIIEPIGIFLLWLFTLYWIHRATHNIAVLKKIHWAHHKYIFKNRGNLWNWKILFLYNDDTPSTIDTWMSEVIPTILISWVTNSWWLFIFFYVWAAFVQEFVRHNPKINLYPILTTGKWHLEHHRNWRYNYGLFFPVFDILFKTNKKAKL